MGPVAPAVAALVFILGLVLIAASEPGNYHAGIAGVVCILAAVAIMGSRNEGQDDDEVG